MLDQLEHLGDLDLELAVKLPSAHHAQHPRPERSPGTPRDVQRGRRPPVNDDYAPVVRQISDTISVMHNGRRVDGGLVETVFPHPESDHIREPIDAILGRSARLSG